MYDLSEPTELSPFSSNALSIAEVKLTPTPTLPSSSRGICVLSRILRTHDLRCAARLTQLCTTGAPVCGSGSGGARACASYQGKHGSNQLYELMVMFSPFGSYRRIGTLFAVGDFRRAFLRLNITRNSLLLCAPETRSTILVCHAHYSSFKKNGT